MNNKSVVVFLFSISLALSACNPDSECPNGASINIKIPSGSCYDVQVSSEDGDTIQQRICSSMELTVSDGSYDYSVEQDGKVVASGSKTVSCGEELTINLGASNTSSNTSQGKASGAIQLQCGCWGPDPANMGEFKTSLCQSGKAIFQWCNWACPNGGTAWGRICL